MRQDHCSITAPSGWPGTADRKSARANGTADTRDRATLDAHHRKGPSWLPARNRSASDLQLSRPGKRDARNLKFAAIPQSSRDAPKEYDFDLKHPESDAHVCQRSLRRLRHRGPRAQTLRFELIEQKKKLQVTDKDVLRSI